MKVSRRDNADRYYLLQAFGYGIFLHHLHRSEEKDLFHNHPWPWFSVVFGSYIDERPFEAIRKVRFFNYGRSWELHRIEVDKPVWTLFFHGRRNNVWGVYQRNGGEWRQIASQPWRGVGGPTSYRGDQ